MTRVVGAHLGRLVRKIRTNEPTGPRMDGAELSALLFVRLDSKSESLRKDTQRTGIKNVPSSFDSNESQAQRFSSVVVTR